MARFDAELRDVERCGAELRDEWTNGARCCGAAHWRERDERAALQCFRAHAHDAHAEDDAPPPHEYSMREYSMRPFQHAALRHAALQRAALQLPSE